MTNGIIFCVSSILAIAVLQLVLKEWQKERNKIQGKKESQRGLYHLRRQKAWGRKVMEVRVLGVRKLRKMLERCNSLSTVTCTQHAFATQGMMTKLGLSGTCSTRFSSCKKIWNKTMVISSSWLTEKVIFCQSR